MFFLFTDQKQKKKNKRNDYSGPLYSAMQSHAGASSLPSHLPAVFLKEITDNFASERELGRSIYGTVYKV